MSSVFEAAPQGRAPRKLRALLPLLRRLPRPAIEWSFAAAAIVDGVLRNGRFGRAVQWADAQGRRGLARQRLALAVLANHGRYVAEEALTTDRGGDGRRIVLEGAEHLARLEGAGALLLGFHLGPPNAWFALRALGYPVRIAGRFAAAPNASRWQEALSAGDAIPLSNGAPAARVESLYQLRGLLRDGALVYMTADGPFGREADRLALPGGAMIIRGGWLALRRATGVATLPMLTYRAGGRQTIAVHAPLPAPVDDDACDLAACRDALSPLLADYVERFPTQCRWLATGKTRAAAGASGERANGSQAPVIP